jgi:hypothetical protein
MEITVGKRGADALDADGVPLEYSIEWLTCAIASRLDVVMVGLPGASQDRLPAHVPGARPGRPGLPQRVPLQNLPHGS